MPAPAHLAAAAAHHSPAPILDPLTPVRMAVVLHPLAAPDQPGSPPLQATAVTYQVMASDRVVSRLGDGGHQQWRRDE
jgi:hypothetical protein